MPSRGPNSAASQPERVACVELPALPLQLLLHDHPSWRSLPVAVVEADRPQAKLLWTNDLARDRRVLPGMRFAAARSLAPQLRAAVVPRERIEHATSELFALLLDFSPRIELEPAQPGTFWVDPSGMTPLWGELDAWAEAMHGALTSAGFITAVIVGFHRFRCHAIARDRGEQAAAWLLPSPQREARMAAAVGLDRLAISPRLRDALAGLGVRTLGEFMALPGPELRVRFGPEAARLHQRASDGHWAPLQARALVDPVREKLELDPPIAATSRLLFAIKPALERLLEALAARGCAMAALDLRLELDHAPGLTQRIEPAAPTLDLMQLLDLLRLRLDAVELAAPVESVTLELDGQRTDPGQIALFRAQVRRDLDAANQALARIVASFGPESVTTAQLRPAHLPEARLRWVPVKQVRFPHARHMQVEGELRPRVRRLLHRPRPLPARSRREPDGWIIDPELGPVERLQGPYRASGAWWVREVERDYYFAHTRSGAVLWVFYDRPRRRWFMHGWLD